MKFTLKHWARWLLIFSGWVYLMLVGCGIAANVVPEINQFVLTTVSLGTGYMFKERQDEKANGGIK